MRGIMRRLRLDRSPLRRTVDRVEAVVMVVLVVVFLAGAPLATFTVVRHVAASGARVERAEASWRQVPAVLLQDVPQTANQVSSMPLVRVRWTAPNGTRHVGEVYAPAGATAGTTVMVWTDGSGTLETMPVEREYLLSQEVFAALMTVTLITVAMAVAAILTRYALDRRRLAAWDAEWSRTGPQWTGQL